MGDEQWPGDLRVVVNLNLDFADSSGALWGTATVDLDAFDGGYADSWTAHWTTSDPLAPDAWDNWAGRVVRGGFGELEGWQARGTILERTHVLTLEEGLRVPTEPAAGSTHRCGHGRDGPMAGP